MAEEFLKRYFPDSVEYPRLELLRIRPGTFYEYTCLPPLNFVSLHLDSPLTRAALVTRYRTYAENQASAERAAQLGGHHMDIGVMFDDDLLILGRSASPDHIDDTVWWVLWYDRDVSDCSMGYFRTEDPEADVVRRFEEYLKEMCVEFNNFYVNQGEGPVPEPIYLLTEQFRGWWHW